ncbi:hypothetical protein N7486_007964 [Penicillium sp. IBT 16267x]|nr:hypothetical protein N7486_007964 [Penicillium sp. IBT 16267x]
MAYPNVTASGCYFLDLAGRYEVTVFGFGDCLFFFVCCDGYVYSACGCAGCEYTSWDCEYRDGASCGYGNVAD